MRSGDFQLLVGLGNPGSKYKKTRHNVGYMALERIAEKKLSVFSMNKKLFGQIASIQLRKEKTRLLIPNTYMNESGRSVIAAMKWFELQKNQILIVVDDMDLPLGTIRFRERGSAGGHNGLKSIINHLGSQDFCRLRIGIGAPSQIAEERKQKTISHVLGDFNKIENRIVQDVLDHVIRGLELIYDFGIERGSTYLNSYKSDIEIDSDD